MHFLGPDQMHGFERRLTPEIYPSRFAWTPDWTKGAYPNPGSAVNQLATSGLCDWSMQLDYDEEVCFRSEEALRHLARREEGDRPFFLCASLTHPHDPFITTSEWWDLYDHDSVEMPAVDGKPLDDMHPYDRWLQIHHMVDVYPPDEDTVRNARHAFYGMVSYFDHQVGRLVGELERLGLSENTIIVVTSDHGEMLGEHGMWFKRTYFDPSTRVPLIFSGPGIRRDHRCEETVSLVDLFPTFLDIAGLPDVSDVVQKVDGDSLWNLLSDEDTAWKDYAVSEYYSEGVCQPMRMAVRNQLKYVYVHEEAPQLFDLAQDPHEVHNCIADPVYADRLDELKSMVHEGWDPTEVRAKVIESQQMRRYVNEAEATGGNDSWDVRPSFDPAEQYVRRYDAQETSRRMKLPKE
jgi:choline-sulfatase